MFRNRGVTLVVTAAVVVGLMASALQAPGVRAVSAGGDPAALNYRPDARIRLACGYYNPCEPDWVGDDVYNTTAAGQVSRWTDYRVSVGLKDPRTVVFRISIQNDGTVADRFRLDADGTTSGYSVQFFRRTTDITAAVEAGTYQTRLLSAGETVVIKAMVTMPCGGGHYCGQDKALRVVTIASTGNPARQDAVKFVRKLPECGC